MSHSHLFKVHSMLVITKWEHQTTNCLLCTSRSKDRNSQSRKQTWLCRIQIQMCRRWPAMTIELSERLIRAVFQILKKSMSAKGWQPPTRRGSSLSMKRFHKYQTSLPKMRNLVRVQSKRKSRPLMIQIKLQRSA